MPHALSSGNRTRVPEGSGVTWHLMRVWAAVAAAIAVWSLAGASGRGGAATPANAAASDIYSCPGASLAFPFASGIVGWTYGMPANQQGEHPDVYQSDGDYKHTGVDLLPGPWDTTDAGRRAVYAPLAGTIASGGVSNGYNLTGTSLAIYIAHLDRPTVADAVKYPQGLPSTTMPVVQGQLIGYTMPSYGNHLHISVHTPTFGNDSVFANTIDPSLAFAANLNWENGSYPASGTWPQVANDPTPICDPDDGRTLTSGVAYTGNLAVTNDHDTFYINGNKDQVVSIAMNANTAGLDTYLSLQRPVTSDWLELQWSDDANGTRNANITNVILPATGRYRIAARSFAEYSAGSYQIVATVTSQPPPAPTSVNATANGPGANVTWAWSSSVTDVQTFSVYRWKWGTGNAVSLVGVVAGTARGITDPGPFEASTLYFYYVIANNSGGSTWSQGFQFTSPGGPPAAPTNVRSTALSSSAVRIDWSDASSNELGFVLLRSTGGPWSVNAWLPAGATTYTDTNLDPSTYYWYWVWSYGWNGPATTAPITLALTAPTGTLTFNRAFVRNRSNGQEVTTMDWGGNYDIAIDVTSTYTETVTVNETVRSTYGTPVNSTVGIPPGRNTVQAAYFTYTGTMGWGSYTDVYTVGLSYAGWSASRSTPTVTWQCTWIWGCSGSSAAPALAGDAGVALDVKP